MLSNSRFIEDQTILKLKVETESIKQARFKNIGENIIIDYRGANVYSSFEKFEYFNTSWVIIAEMDQAEVISKHYQNHKKYLNKYILSYVERRKPKPVRPPGLVHPDVRVDVNEWSKALAGEILQTSGVSTCTAYAIKYPGKFAYLAHISAVDAVYNIDGFAKKLLKDRSTNFVRELTNRVRHYDITLSELPRLEFLIVATHANSYSLMLDQLLAQGVDLDQIRFAYNPAAKSAEVILDVRSNQTIIVWHSGIEYFMESAGEYETIGSIVKAQLSSR